jgi:hypothetical protein
VINEADTCRKYVLPKLYAAGWNDDQTPASYGSDFAPARKSKMSKPQINILDYTVPRRGCSPIRTLTANPRWSPSRR